MCVYFFPLVCSTSTIVTPCLMVNTSKVVCLSGRIRESNFICGLRLCAQCMHNEQPLIQNSTYFLVHNKTKNLKRKNTARERKRDRERQSERREVMKRTPNTEINMDKFIWVGIARGLLHIQEREQ